MELVPLPSWEPLSSRQIRERIAGIVREIEAQTREALREGNSTVLGQRRILRQSPHDRPSHSSQSPAPRFHAATWETRKVLELAYYGFRIAYRQAAEDLLSGLRRVEFPPGAFPPRFPFVRARPSPIPV